jgi:hypothetical protein
MGPSWLRFMFRSRVLARATFGFEQMQRMYVLPYKVGRHVSMVRARTAASNEIELTDLLLRLFRSRQGVHYARKVSTDISACFCRWRRDDSVGYLKVEMNRTLPVVVEGALFSMASLNQDESHSTARQKSCASQQQAAIVRYLKK